MYVHLANHDKAKRGERRPEDEGVVEEASSVCATGSALARSSKYHREFKARNAGILHVNFLTEITRFSTQELITMSESAPFSSRRLLPLLTLATSRSRPTTG